MRTVLHILTRRDDALAARLISLQREQSEVSVVVAELFDHSGDYSQLLDKIFHADSVATW